MKRTALWLGILLLLTALLGGCGGSSMKMSEQGSTGSMPMAAPAEAPAAMPPGARSMAAADGVQVKGSQESKPAAGAGAPPALDRKIIQNAQLDVKIKEADEAIATITQHVRAAGGYVQDERVEGTRQHGRRVSMSIRVPAGAYGSLLDLLTGLGEVNNRRTWINDVTEEYLDLDARIRTKEAHLEQLRKIYARSGTIKELLELEAEIARVTAELESIKGRFNFLSNQVAFSTIVVILYEPGVPTPIKTPETVWDRMKNGFIQSYNNLVNLTAEIAIFLVVSIPALVYLTVLGLIAWGVTRVLRRRRGGPPAPPSV